MKKILVLLLIGFISTSVYSQRWLVKTLTDYHYIYKKHYSHSIEEGVEDGRFMQYVAGNKTDWGVYNKSVTGHKFNETNLISCVEVQVADNFDNVHLTDFTVHKNLDPRYGAGTGVYYPNGATGSGFPFFGLYDKESGQITSAVYYRISYPGAAETTHTAGLRIKYSDRANSYYISGVMIDRRFGDLDFYNLDVRSKGFILKVDYKGLHPTYLEFTPDQIFTSRQPSLCTVTDLEINPEGNMIAFTGINTEDELHNYHHPMVGVIDLDLNLRWCKVYEQEGDRYSGVDVEYRIVDGRERILVLSNSTKDPFTVMEVDHMGNPTQAILKQLFYDPATARHGAARAHSMHIIGKQITITGNCFVGNPQEQLLFSYNINDANDLASNPDHFFKSYSREMVPLGKQREVTSYWAPENSVYQNDNLFIVGVHNRMVQDPPYYGFTFINRNGIDPHCIETGEVENIRISTRTVDRRATRYDCEWRHFPTNILGCLPDYELECVSKMKTSSADETLFEENIRWELKETNEDGIHGVLFSEEANDFKVDVYDVLGRNVFSSEYSVKYGEKDIFLKFNMNPEVYIIRITNGVEQETLKILGK